MRYKIIQAATTAGFSAYLISSNSVAVCSKQKKYYIQLTLESNLNITNTDGEHLATIKSNHFSTMLFELGLFLGKDGIQ